MRKLASLLSRRAARTEPPSTLPTQKHHRRPCIHTGLLRHRIPKEPAQRQWTHEQGLVRSAGSKWTQNNLNSHEPVRASNAAHDPNRPLCGVGDHVGRLCVHGDSPNWRTWAARESVFILWYYILCVQVTGLAGTLQLEPNLVAQTIETITLF